MENAASLVDALNRLGTIGILLLIALVGSIVIAIYVYFSGRARARRVDVDVIQAQTKQKTEATMADMFQQMMQDSKEDHERNAQAQRDMSAEFLKSLREMSTQNATELAIRDKRQEDIAVTFKQMTDGMSEINKWADRQDANYAIADAKLDGISRQVIDEHLKTRQVVLEAINAINEVKRLVQDTAVISKLAQIETLLKKGDTHETLIALPVSSVHPVSSQPVPDKPAASPKDD